MNIQKLYDLPSWEWPENADKTILAVLTDDKADHAERMIAAELAGDYTVVDDTLTEALLSILQDKNLPEDLRARAAFSFGPALEGVDTYGFDDPDEVNISEPMFNKIRKVLHELYLDTSLARDVRRRAFEASVRAPQDWHTQAIREAYASGDPAWKLTAVFGMRHVRGFDEQILEALDSEDPEILHEAICAAGNWELKKSLPRVAQILSATDAEPALRLAAIEAVIYVDPNEAKVLLGALLEDEDDDVANAAHEALAMAGALLGEEPDEEGDADGDWDEDFDFDDELYN